MQLMHTISSYNLEIRVALFDVFYHVDLERRVTLRGVLQEDMVNRKSQLYKIKQINKIKELFLFYRHLKNNSKM